MGQLKKLLDSLSISQRIAILVAVSTVGGALWYLVHWRQESDFRPLFKAMSAEDASSVIQRLKESGVPYRIAENGATIMVPSEKAAELRLEMASAGLPRSGRIGFELFDHSNFGITDFNEQVNFRRAIEGELERSVMSIAEVEQARVHVTFPKDSVYLDARQPAKASVLVRMKLGARLTPQSVVAITHLTASAVEGLVPESVSVLDMRGNLLSRPRRGGADSLDLSDTNLEYREKLERDLAGKINATLEPIFGSNRFRTGVFVDCDFTSGEQSEEILDPDRSIMVTSQRTEDRFESAAAAGGVPGSASALPRPTSGPSTSPGGTSRRTENITYQTSRTMKRVKLAQGEIRRLSVSVLVDHNSRWQGEGPGAKRILTPPSPEKLKSVRDLVAGIIGFDEERGDQLIIESLAFESTENEEPPAAKPQTPSTPQAVPLNWQTLIKDPKVLGGAACLLLLIAGLVFAVIRVTRKRRPALVMPPQLAGESSEPKSIGASSEQAKQAYAQQEVTGGATLSLPSASASRLETRLGPLREEVRKEPEAYAAVVRAWLSESE